jgi:hypothetical protein
MNNNIKNFNKIVPNYEISGIPSQLCVYCVHNKTVYNMVH